MLHKWPICTPLTLSSRNIMILLPLQFVSDWILVIFIHIYPLLLVMNSESRDTSYSSLCSVPNRMPSKRLKKITAKGMDKPNSSLRCSLTKSQSPREKETKMRVASWKLWPEITDHLYNNLHISVIITLSILPDKQDWAFLFLISTGTRKVWLFWNLSFLFLFSN